MVSARQRRMMPRYMPKYPSRQDNATRESPVVVTFTSAGGTVYKLPVHGRVRRMPFPDSPPVSPTSGDAQVRSRQHHNAVSIKDIADAFASDIDLDFESRGGVLRTLAGSTCTTNFKSGIWNAPFENNPTDPGPGGGSGDTSWMGPRSTNTGSQPKDVSGPNFNPKATRFFRGTANQGVFTGRVVSVTADDYDLEFMLWGGTSWSVADLFLAASAQEDTHIFSFEVHKGALHVAYADASGVIDVASTTTGDGTWADLSQGPSLSTGTQGAVLLVDDGSRLYAFGQTAAGTVNVSSTDDDGSTPWDARGLFRGKLRDVDRFRDLDGNGQIVVLTEEALYWYDTTNFVIELLLPLPFLGRAMIPWGDKLVIFMDGGRVIEYEASGANRDISPYLGVIGAFGTDSNSQVCVTRGTKGVYSLFDGFDGSGSAQKPLCLLWDGAGWHFVWQKADTSISGAGRFVTIDPVSGDLLIGVHDATGSTDTTHIRLKDIETDPADQTTLDRKTSGTITTRRLDFGSPLVSTTLWDAFLHSNGVDADETFTVKYRTNGSTGAYTTVGSAITSDNYTIDFPDDASAAAGLNFRDVQLQVAFALNAKTDLMRLFSIDLGYDRAWPVRNMHILDVVNFEDSDLPPTDQTLTDIATILGLATKGTLTYSGSSYTALPIATDSRVDEAIGELVGQKRTGTSRLVLLEA